MPHQGSGFIAQLPLSPTKVTERTIGAVNICMWRSSITWAIRCSKALTWGEEGKSKKEETTPDLLSFRPDQSPPAPGCPGSWT